MATSSFLSRDPDRVRVFGDWHGNVQFALDQISDGIREGITTYLHVGDFGLWPFGIPRSQWPKRYVFVSKMQRLLEENDAAIGFIDGNHEDFRALSRLPRSAEGLGAVSPSIFHLARGTTWEWRGTRFGGMGGAISIDRQTRRLGHTWFPEEAITAADVALMEQAGSVDVLITHEAPARPVRKHPFTSAIEADCADSVRSVAHLVTSLTPQVAVHGHYHRAYRSKQEFPGTEVIGLDCDMGTAQENYVDLYPGAPRLLGRGLRVT